MKSTVAEYFLKFMEYYCKRKVNVTKIKMGPHVNPNKK
jgi:hypothetical protein